VGHRALRAVFFSERCGRVKVLHPEGFGLRQAALVSIVAGLVCLSGLGASAAGQEPDGFGGRWSYGVSWTYSPDSSHILIGQSEQRRIWTVGGTYSHVLHQSPHFRFDYEAAVMPVWEERDPTVTGTEFFVSGQAVVTQLPPVRVARVTNQPVGMIPTGNNLTPTPEYALFGTQNTYAAAITPLGARVSAMPRWRLQPTFALDLGFVFGSRSLPIDDATAFNYMFAIGPGLQFYAGKRNSLRVEYVYRHFSNAGQGNQNPGVDQAVVRVTVSRHR
jgi:hypothetical protein